MQITVEIDEKLIEEMVNRRVRELFKADDRYGNSSVSAYQLVKKLTDEAVAKAITSDVLKELISKAVAEKSETALKRACEQAVDTRIQRMIRMGFKPERLTEEHKAWLMDQIEKQMDAQSKKALKDDGKKNEPSECKTPPSA